MKYLLGIDNGGTFSKAAIFDEIGQQIAVVSEPTKTLTPKPGFTERDMNELWNVNAQAIRKVISVSNVNPADILAVSFSGHGKGLYLVDDSGNPTHPGIVSTDSRAWEIVKKWNEDGTREKVYPLTYQDILASQPVSLLAWLKNNSPEVIKKTRYIFSVKDYIRYKMTGEAYGEYSDFSGGNLINLNTKKYDQELLSMFGLEEIYSKLPPLKHSAELSGYISEDAAKQTNLVKGTPVAAGMFDVNACGIASGLSDEEQICMIAGTWSINEYIRKSPVTDGSVSLNSMFCIPGYYLVEESSPTSAGNMEWFIRNLMDQEKVLTEKNNESIYALANNWVSQIEPSDCNLIFLPFLNGSNENPIAKGSFIGLSSYHTKKHMLRAVYEGVVFSHLTHVNKLLINREKPKSLRLSGGASKSDVWVQIFADVMQVPIDVIEDKEIGAHGAAIAAGIAAGIYTDYETAINKSVKISKTIEPRDEYRSIYEKKYHLYRAVVDSLNDTWKLFQN